MRPRRLCVLRQCSRRWRSSSIVFGTAAVLPRLIGQSSWPQPGDRPTLPEQLGFSHARLPKGHGTSLAAAEANGRVCYGLEIDSRYCDVIIQRWQNMSGRHATLEGDGRTFEQIKTARL